MSAGARSRSVRVVFRPLKPYQIAVDVVFAVLVVLAGLVMDLGLGPVAIGGTFVGRLPLLCITFVLVAALALRRAAPALALGTVWVAALLQMAFGMPPLFIDVAIFGVLYAAAAYGSRLVMWLAFASGALGAALIALYLIVPPLVGGGFTITDALSQYFVVGLAVWVAATFALLLSWTVGALVRTAHRARANREAQMRAEDEAIVEQERVTIARDMHDVVAHSLAVVIAQADGARYAAASDPQAAAMALGTISSTARAALTDVRLLLTQLRHNQTDGPQPSLADLEQLYAQVRSAGVALRVDVDPMPVGEQPAAVQLAVYRILQEALTNALRHGDGTGVAVSLSWRPDRVDLSVRNGIRARAALAGGARPGAPGEAWAADTAPGHGLIGMRERAQLVGGTLTAGASTTEFVVAGSIPLAPAVGRAA
jgi:signal transduction histidine kinase